MPEDQQQQVVVPAEAPEEEQRRQAIISQLQPQTAVTPPSAPPQGGMRSSAPIVVPKETPIAKPQSEDVQAPSVTMAPSKPFSLPQASAPVMPRLAPEGVAKETGVPLGRKPGIPGTVDPNTGKDVPYTPQQKLNPFAGLFAHAENINNPFLRTLAKIGSGIGSAAEGVTDAFNPEQKEMRMKEQMLPMEEAKTKAEIAQKEASAEQQKSQAKTNEQAASHDLFPVRNADGSVTFQKVERDLTGEEFAKLTPDQQVSYAGFKAVEGKGTPEGELWAQRAEQAKAGAQAGVKPTVVAPENQPVSADRIAQINNEIGQLPGLTPEQKKTYAPAGTMTAGQAEKQLADAHTLAAQLQTQAEHNTQQDAKLLQDKVKALRPPIQKEYDNSGGQLEKIDQAKTELSSGNAGQAVGVVKTLSGLASGQGSGVRITGAELKMLISNTRGTAGDLSAAWDKITGGENIVLTKDQITSLNGLLDHVKSHLVMKRDIADHQLHAMDTATTKQEAVQASDDLRRYLKAVEQNKAYNQTMVNATAQRHKMTPEDVIKQFKKEGGVEVPE
jgi:hypothetical protein